MARTNFFDIPDTGEPFPKDFPKQDQEMILAEERKFANELMRWFYGVIDRIVSEKIGDEDQKKFEITKKDALEKLDAGDFLMWFDDTILWSEFSDDLRIIIKSFLYGILKRSGTKGPKSAEIPLDMNYLDKEILKALKKSEIIIPKITDSIRNNLRDLIYSGLAIGKTISQVKNDIKSIKNIKGQQIFSPERALRIASTEMIRAYNQGAVARFKSSGVVRGMRWVSAAKGFCPRCGALDGKVVPLGEVFYEDPTFGDGMPPRHPHCRCSVIPVTLKEAKSGQHETLTNDYRNSLQELFDDDSFTIINGVKVTGGARNHYIRKHGIQINDRKPHFRDLDYAEKLLVEVLNGKFDSQKVKENKVIYETKYSRKNNLRVIVGEDDHGEKKLFTMYPVSK